MSPDQYGSDIPPQGQGQGVQPENVPPQEAPQGPPPGYPPPDHAPPGTPQGYPPPGYPPGSHRRDRRPEKQNEKETEKQQEKGRNLDEKYRRNPLRIVSLSLFVIWLGVSLLLMNTDVIKDDSQGWAIFVWGLAAIVFVEALIRLAVPKWRRSVMGSFIWGAIWAGVGFGLWFDRWEVIGPLVIIAIGLAILLGRLLPRS